MKKLDLLYQEKRNKGSGIEFREGGYGERERETNDKRDISKEQSEVYPSFLTFETEGMLSSAKRSRGTQKNEVEIQDI